MTTENSKAKEVIIQSKESRQHAHKGVVYGLIQRLFLASVPIIALFSGGYKNSLLYAALWLLGYILASAIHLAKHRKEYYKYFDLKEIGRLLNVFFLGENPATKGKEYNRLNLNGYRSFLAPFYLLHVLLLTLSLIWLPAILVITVYVSWEVIFQFFLNPPTKKNTSERISKFVAYLITLISLCILTFSAIRIRNHLFDLSAFNLSVGIGLILLFLAVLLQAQFVVHRRRYEAKDNNTDLTKGQRVERDFSRLLVAMIYAIILFALGFIFQAQNTFSGVISNLSLWGYVLAVVSGALYLLATNFRTLANACFKKSENKFWYSSEDSDLEIDAHTYRESRSYEKYGIGARFVNSSTLTLGIALVLFFIFRPHFVGTLTSASEIGLFENTAWTSFVIGIIGISAMNLIALFKEQQGKFGLSSLVISLWVFAAAVLYRDYWEQWQSKISTFTVSNFEYFAFVGVIATVFALIIAFEISRVETRTTQEEESVFYLANLFYKRGDKNSLKNLEELDRVADPEDIPKYYNNLISSVEKGSSTSGYDSIEDDKHPEVKVNALVRSKLYGVSISESLITLILALFTIGLSLFLRPSKIADLTAVSIDTFSILMPSAISYLVFHLFDLKTDRRKEFFELENGKPRVVSSALVGRHESRIATFLVAAMLCGFTTLLCIKWLVW